MDDAMYGSMAQTVMYVLWNIHTHDFLHFAGKGRTVGVVVFGGGVYNAVKIITKFPGKHIYFSTYHFNGASQSMIGYKYMQDERSGRGET
jgi:hypothetical protein